MEEKKEIKGKVSSDRFQKGCDVTIELSDFSVSDLERLRNCIEGERMGNMFPACPSSGA